MAGAVHPAAAEEFTVESAIAPCPPVSEGGAVGPVARGLTVTGLPRGDYVLQVAGHGLVKATADEWAQGIELRSDPDDPAVQRVEKLRKLLVSKNVQYFNKYRPANETYIFLFRKGEQGRNAVEIPQFDAPIAQLEAEVAKLRKPEPVTYTLVKE
jgi:hypothetical protein